MGLVEVTVHKKEAQTNIQKIFYHFKFNQGKKCYQRTNEPTDQRMYTPFYRDAWKHLVIKEDKSIEGCF